METDLVSSIPAVSERETIMKYIWGRCEDAWAEGEDEEAQAFHRMYIAFEMMTDGDVHEVIQECEAQDV